MTTLKIDDLPIIVAAVGALGVASFGIVDALGKALFVFDLPVPVIRFGDGGSVRLYFVKSSLGLPYVGFEKVRSLSRQLGPALQVSYGSEFDSILRQQYRAGRSQGQAPDFIRQGVRLGLPFLGLDDAARIINAIWGLPQSQAMALAQALTAEKQPATDGSPLATAPEAVAASQALAVRFSTALDTRVQAAFDLAEEIYQARARLWAATTAIVLSIAYHASTLKPKDPVDLGGWFIALLVGLAAVPLAPIAKDLASSLSDALGALGRLRDKSAG